MDNEVKNLQICMQGIKKDVEYIRESLRFNQDDHKEIRETLNAFIKASEKRFAPMWAATVLKFVMGTAGLALVTAILSLVINK